MITAYRSWWLTEDGWLRPLGAHRAETDLYWQPGVNHAFHDHSHDDWFSLLHVAWARLPHRSPKKKCRCGIYAYKDLHEDRHRDSWGLSVNGSVQIWGKIVEHELGYRAEYAQIIKLFPNQTGDPEMIRVFNLAAQRYDVPVGPP